MAAKPLGAAGRGWRAARQVNSEPAALWDRSSFGGRFPAEPSPQRSLAAVSGEEVARTFPQTGFPLRRLFAAKVLLYPDESPQMVSEGFLL